jgi:hypothetical protein
MTNYYDDWKELPQTCRACGWQGRGCDLTQGEVFAELFEVCCPKCGEKVLTVSFPTIDESRRNWDKVSPQDHIAVELAERRRQEFERRMLRSPDQLPDLEGEDLILVWDRDDSHGRESAIHYGAQVLWREPGFYEDYERFEEVAEILFAKYGERLQDLVPTRASHYSQYGDRIGAPYRIKKFREALGQRGRTAN